MRFRFEVPLGGVKARLVTLSDAEIEQKDYAYAFRFQGRESGPQLAKEVGLPFSSNLDGLYQYSSNNSPGKPSRTRYFSIPEPTAVEVDVVPWGKKSIPAPIADLYLEVRAFADGHGYLTLRGQRIE